ncbi:hypothetical protein QOZ80_7BG0613880 [Eleusine coracana subsp. coracana]|nr:hypothetical protein QOZ80_7BG0613880 [Eleusine coracana subsp. coracana]
MVGCPMMSSSVSNNGDATLGGHIARRLVQVGVSDVFGVPGDFNLTLLDHLIAEPGLRFIGCCNELNAGYAADGYARAKGVGACAVTFTVGGLSVLNAIAGAYSENLPVICIVGGPNSNDYGTNRILHHTIGLPDFSQLGLEAAGDGGSGGGERVRGGHHAVGQGFGAGDAAALHRNLLGRRQHRLLRRDRGVRRRIPLRGPHLQRLQLRRLLGQPPESQPGEPLRVNVLFKHIQKMLTGDSAVIAETGDSWFNCQKLKLPQGCGYEFQMQYGSIGWSVGALLGYAQAATNKRVIACIGDGSFQVTAQDVSTMLRCDQKSIIFLINNGGYTIEVEIHDGLYNVIKNWNYTALIDAIHNGDGNCWTTKVTCEEELTEAVHTATGHNKDCLCFIEVIAHKDDTSKELLEWGSRVCAANSRPPNPQ